MSSFTVISNLQFVNGGITQTVAQLFTNYPANSSLVGYYAHVSDWCGGLDEIFRCTTDGVTYYWRPQRTDYAVSMSQSSGSMTLIPFVTPPNIFLTTTLLGNLTVTPDTTNAYPGLKYEITAPALLGIFAINFTGLVGGITSNLLGGSTRVLEYTAAGYKGK